MGCLGAWTVRTLLDEQIPVVALDLSTDDRRLRLLASDKELARVRLVHGDITDPATVARVVREERVTHIVHLAALQIPLCRADPVLGARVNVVGTVNVFEAAVAARDRVRGLVYASSAAVFGPSEQYASGHADDEAPLAPGTLYGVYKQANEGTARVYAEEHGLGSVGLRPYIVYGVGRDQGLTSGTTAAMCAAAAGRPYRIGFGGTAVYQLAADAARIFVAAARATPPEATVLNMGGSTASVGQVVAAIEEEVPEATGSITYDDAPLPFPAALDASGLDSLIGVVAYTPLAEGVRRTIEAFRSLLARGLLSPPPDLGESIVPPAPPVPPASRDP
jgi:UDP-glucuronate 4-epimerase